MPKTQSSTQLYKEYLPNNKKQNQQENPYTKTQRRNKILAHKKTTPKQRTIFTSPPNIQYLG
jgi:hypothetical protein